MCRKVEDIIRQVVPDQYFWERVGYNPEKSSNVEKQTAPTNNRGVYKKGRKPLLRYVTILRPLSEASN
ncbi:MAG: hypothetical protein HAW67_01395 [Endozoicomonadaceae bacterium]|nr:hypothetical protein [Endozoicomonadaceae bacterium]